MTNKQTLAIERTELRLHTTYSASQGLCDVEEAIHLAASSGHGALAITDYMTAQAFPAAALACKKIQAAYPGFKLIYGCEIGFIPDGKRRLATGLDVEPSSFNMTLLAINQAGLKNLYKIITESNRLFGSASTAHKNYVCPPVTQQLLEEHREGLLLGSAGAQGELFYAMLTGQSEDRLEYIAGYYDYLEIQPVAAWAGLAKGCKNLPEEQAKQYIKAVLDMGKELNKPVAAASNPHFLRPENAMEYAALQARDNDEVIVKPPPLFFHTTEEMLLEFAWLPRQDAYDVVIRYPNLIAGMVSPAISPIAGNKMLIPNIKGSEAALRSLALENARRKYGNPLPEFVEKRLERELEGICGSGHSSLFMLAQMLTEKSRQMGYPSFSRGAAGSSLAGFFVGISEVNPLLPHYICNSCRYSEAAGGGEGASGFDLPPKSCPCCGKVLVGDGHNIPMETFLGLNGNKLPLTDINYTYEFVKKAFEQLGGFFGEDNVLYAGTVVNIAHSEAKRLVQKAYAYNGNGVLNHDKQNNAINKLKNVKDSGGWFSGALFIVPEGYDVYDFTAVEYNAVSEEKSVPCTHFDYRQLEKKLLRINVLDHDTATMLHYLEKHTGINPGKIPMNDTEVYSLLTSPAALGVSSEAICWETGTLGVPELDTLLICSIMSMAGVNSFEGLIKAFGLSKGNGTWFGNAREALSGGQCSFSELIATRDDVYLYLLGKGLPAEQAVKAMEQVKCGRGLGKGTGNAALPNDYDVPGWFIESCDKIGYLFPKAHIVSYLIASIRILWYKLYHPRAFYSAHFSLGKNRFAFCKKFGDAAALGEYMNSFAGKDYLSFGEEKQLEALRLANESLCRGIGLLFE